MSPAPPYTVIALCPELAADEEKQLAARLAQVFSRPAPAAATFARGGFSVGETSALEQASALLQQVLQLGANGRIVDAKGAVLREASTPAGTFPLAAADEALSKDAAAGLLAGLGLNSAAVAPGSAPAADPLDDLVFLDGSSEVKAAPPPARQKEPALRPNAFAPPDEQTPLELDQPRAASSRGLTARSTGTRLPLARQPERADEAPKLAPSSPRPPAPPAATAAPLPQPGPRRAASLAASPAAGPLGPTASAPSLRRAGSARQQKIDLAAAGVSLLTAGEPGRLLWGGRLRACPRLRLLLGFVLALGLGGILPACHARLVVASQLEPQREDLATAQAHGTILAQLPNYRSPETIEQTISGIRTRSSIVTFILWLAGAGGLGFVWFRFT